MKILLFDGTEFVVLTLWVYAGLLECLCYVIHLSASSLTSRYSWHHVLNMVTLIYHLRNLSRQPLRALLLLLPPHIQYN